MLSTALIGLVKLVIIMMVKMTMMTFGVFVSDRQQKTIWTIEPMGGHTDGRTYFFKGITWSQKGVGNANGVSC